MSTTITNLQSTTDGFKKQIQALEEEKHLLLKENTQLLRKVEKAKITEELEHEIKIYSELVVKVADQTEKVNVGESTSTQKTFSYTEQSSEKSV